MTEKLMKYKTISDRPDPIFKSIYR